MVRFHRIACTWAIVSAMSMPFVAGAAPGDTELVSVNATTNVAAGLAGDGSGWVPVSLSADGRYVAFSSRAHGLVPGGTQEVWHVYVRDRLTREVRRVSACTTTCIADGMAWGATISATGRYVSFWSPDFVGADGDPRSFLQDLVTDATERVSVNSNGALGNAFDQDYRTSISADGRYVAFTSNATNLVPGDTNEGWDVFVRDRQTRVTERASNDWNGGGGQFYYPVISADGRYVAFANGIVFVHDRVTGRTEHASVSSSGAYANEASYAAALSSDGRYVAFLSRASNLVPGDSDGIQAYVHDRLTGVTERVSVSSGGAKASGGVDPRPLSMSGDGRYIGFASSAPNLVAGDTNQRIDSFVHDRETGQTFRVSVSSTGVQGNGDSFVPSLSADGRFAGFVSYASNLTPNDPSSSTLDVFVHELAGSSPVVYNMYLRPLSIEFGQVALGTALKKGFTLTNAGNVPLPITTAELLGADRSQYALKSYCGATLAVGSRCWISVAFRPTSLGYKQANLHVVAGGIDRHRALRGSAVP